jgi:hypothetical protein
MAQCRRNTCAAQPGPDRPRPAQRARPTVWPSSARCERARGAGTSAHDAVRAAARQACSAVVMSPAHGRRCGEGHGGASPARGRWRDVSSRYRWWRADGTAARWRRRHHDLLAESAPGVASRCRWRGASDTRGQERITARLRTAAVDGTWSGCERLSGWTRAVPTAPLRHGARRVAATRRWCTDRRAWCEERETDKWVPRVSDFQNKNTSKWK